MSLWYCFIPLGFAFLGYAVFEIIERCFYIKIEKKGLVYVVGSVLCATILIIISVIYFFG